MIQYPLECRFKLFALTGKITITDAVQQLLLNGIAIFMLLEKARG